MEKELKRRKSNWSESELMALAEAVAPHFRVLKGKFSAFITSERKNQLWQDIANHLLLSIHAIKGTKFEHLVPLGFFGIIHTFLEWDYLRDTNCLLDLNSQQPPTTQSTSFLNQLLLQEQQLRIELQKQITGIQSQIQANNVVQVAFFVRLRDKITNHHLSTIMVFDDVQLNMGNAYDPHVGTFTAPVEGVYKFDLVLSSNVENGHGEMMHNGVRILDVYADKVMSKFDNFVDFTFVNLYHVRCAIAEPGDTNAETTG
uniref:Complement C1q tumor necrosis factor-related protein 3 n=1 Tax=Magallana gigas TaxID=29159 RepID=K1Q3S1_MAGGI